MGNLKSEFRLAAAILVIGSTVAIDSSWAATWTEINTGLLGSAVDVNAITIALTTPSTIYAGTRSAAGVGGIFKTTDGAGTWKAISSIVGVNSFVVDPTNSETIYAVVGSSVLKSTNGGASWIGAGTGLSDTYVSMLAIDPITPSTLYAFSSSTIFKSTNGGGSWNALNTGFPPNTFISSFVIDPTTSSTIYVTGSFPQPGFGPGVFLKSTDGGQSWNDLTAGLPPNSRIGSLVIAPATPSMIYGIASLPGGPPGGGILQSADGGESWNAIDTGLPLGPEVTSLAVDPTDSSTIYIAVLFPFAQAGGILQSTDGGASWNAIDPRLPANTPIKSLAIDPVTSSDIYLTTDVGIFKSTDAGASWNGASAGLTTIDVHALAVSREDAATVYAAAADSAFKSIDSGANWTKLFAFQLFISTNTGGPAGLTPPFPNGAPAYPDSLLLDFTNPNIVYTATFRPNGCYFADNLLFKSTDGGVSWSDSISPGQSGCVLAQVLGPTSGLKAMDPTDPNTLYLAETDDEDGIYALLRSSDGGASWKNFGAYPGGLQAGVWALAIDPTNRATLYAGMDDAPTYSSDGSVKPGPGGAYNSTDGGASWNSIGLSGAAVNLVAIDPAHPSVLYAGTEGNNSPPRGFRGLFKSTDSGASWTAITAGLTNLIGAGANMTAIVIDPANSNILYAGISGGGVFKSSDGGAHWSQFNDGLGNLDVRTLTVAPGSQHTLYAGTAGGVFKIIDDAGALMP